MRFSTEHTPWRIHLGFQDWCHHGWTENTRSLCSVCRSPSWWACRGVPSGQMLVQRRWPTWRNLRPTQEKKQIRLKCDQCKLHRSLVHVDGEIITQGNHFYYLISVLQYMKEKEQRDKSLITYMIWEICSSLILIMTLQPLTKHFSLTRSKYSIVISDRKVLLVFRSAPKPPLIKKYYFYYCCCYLIVCLSS